MLLLIANFIMHLWFECFQGKLWYQKFKRYITEYCRLYMKHMKNYIKSVSFKWWSLYLSKAIAFLNNRNLQFCQKLKPSIDVELSQFQTNSIRINKRKCDASSSSTINSAWDWLYFVLWTMRHQRWKLLQKYLMAFIHW